MGDTFSLKEVNEDLAENQHDDDETADIRNKINQSVDGSLVYSPVGVDLEYHAMVNTAVIVQVLSGIVAF